MNFRRMILVLAVFSFLAQTIALAQNRSNPRPDADKAQTIEKEILRLEEMGRQKALKGESNWDDLVAEDAYLIQWDGSIVVFRKGQTLPATPLKSFKTSEMIARVYGDAVVVTGLGEVESEIAEKEQISFKMRFLNVWRKFEDHWKIVVSERTVVRPPAK